MAKEVDMAVHDSIDLDAALAQYIRDYLAPKPAKQEPKTTETEKPNTEKGIS